MRNTLYILLVLAFGISSCEDYPNDPKSPGAGFKIGNPGMTFLDNQITYSVTTYNTDVTSVVITGAAKATVALSTGEVEADLVKSPVLTGNVTFMETDINIDKENSWTLRLEATGIPSAAVKMEKTTLKSAFSNLNPYKWTPATGDDPEKKEPTQVTTGTDGLYIEYKVKPVVAEPTNIVVEKKVVPKDVDPKTIDFTAEAGTFVAKGQKIKINGSDYNADDTVIFKFTATANTGKSETVNLSFTVAEAEKESTEE